MCSRALSSLSTRRMPLRRGALQVAWLAIGLCIGSSATGVAQDAPPAGPPTRAEFEALSRELKTQKDLLMQILRMEQERYEFLLKLIQSGGAAAAAIPPVAPSVPAPPEAQAPAGTALRGKSPPQALATGAITGRVNVKGAARGAVYVYVDGLRTAPVRGRALEIQQKDRAFTPTVAVVERGTTLRFPNLDPVFHNVFSPSASQPFDLGTYRAGDPARSVTLHNPGVVEIFCNMHAKMRASVLVVPNAHYARVGTDGTFKLDRVPVGTRKLVVWAPDAKPTARTVELGSAGASVDLDLDLGSPQAHNNKFGQPYGSYND